MTARDVHARFQDRGFVPSTPGSERLAIERLAAATAELARATAELELSVSMLARRVRYLEVVRGREEIAGLADSIASKKGPP